MYSVQLLHHSFLRVTMIFFWNLFFLGGESAWIEEVQATRRLPHYYPPTRQYQKNSNRWFDGLGLDVKKVNSSTKTCAVPWLSNKMYSFIVVSCAAKTKLGMVTQNEGSASSRSKSHTVYIYIYIQYTITYNNNNIYIYTLYCRI